MCVLMGGAAGGTPGIGGRSLRYQGKWERSSQGHGKEESGKRGKVRVEGVTDV